MTDPQYHLDRSIGSNGVRTHDTDAVDDVIDALAHRRRRHVLRCLAERGSAMRLTALATAVARRELDDADVDYADAIVERVRRSLHHRHVPKLADAGLVEYDRTFDAVGLATDDAALEPLLGDAATS